MSSSENVSGEDPVTEAATKGLQHLGLTSSETEQIVHGTDPDPQAQAQQDEGEQ